MRLLVADLAPPEVVRSSLDALDEKLDLQERRLDEAPDAAGSFGPRGRWLMINHRLSRRMIEAQRAWIAEVRAALDG